MSLLPHTPTTEGDIPMTMQYRQGDVLLCAVDGIPPAAKPVPMAAIMAAIPAAIPVAPVYFAAVRLVKTAIATASPSMIAVVIDVRLELTLPAAQ